MGTEVIMEMAAAVDDAALRRGIQQINLLHQYLNTRLSDLGYEVRDTYPRLGDPAVQWWEIQTGIPEANYVLATYTFACRFPGVAPIVRMPSLSLWFITVTDLRDAARQIAERFFAESQSLGSTGATVGCLGSLEPEGA